MLSAKYYDWIDPCGGTALHRSARVDNAKDITLTLQSLAALPGKLLEQLFHYDFAGFTPLHVAVLYNSFEALEAFLRGLEISSACDIASTRDSLGRLPIHLLCTPMQSGGRTIYCDATTGEAKKKFELLRALHLSTPANDFCYKLNPDEIIKRGPAYKNSDALIKVCCDVVNEVGATLKESATHPGLNKLSNKQFAEIDKKINELRKKVKCSEINTWDDLINTITELKKTEAGNCMEFATYTLYLLFVKFGMVGKIGFFENGDHWFVLTNLDPNAPDGRGPNALIIDAWSTDFFFYSEWLHRLKDFYQFYFNNNGEWRAINVVGRTTLLHRIREGINTTVDNSTSPLPAQGGTQPSPTAPSQSASPSSPSVVTRAGRFIVIEDEPVSAVPSQNVTQSSSSHFSPTTPSPSPVSAPSSSSPQSSTPTP